MSGRPKCPYKSKIKEIGPGAKDNFPPNSTENSEKTMPQANETQEVAKDCIPYKYMTVPIYWDTMSSSNILGYSVWKKLRRLLPLQPSRVRIQSMAGHTRPVGQVKVYIRTRPHLKLPVLFQVIKGTETKVLLSFATMQKLHVEVLLQEGNIMLKIRSARIAAQPALWERNHQVYFTRAEQQRVLEVTNLEDNQERPLEGAKINPSLSKEQRSNLQNLLYEYDQLLGDDILQIQPRGQHRIPMKDLEPVNVRQYPLGPAQQEFASQFVQELLEAGMIQESSSPYNAPILVVPKPGKNQWRLTIDYRKLNEKIVKNRYPLPRIENLLQSVSHCNYFTVMDLYSGFYQMGVHPESRPVTAFSTASGHYEWTVLPMGLTISPPLFQKEMNYTLQCIPGVYVYIDDILIATANWDQHLTALRAVFKALTREGYLLKKVKCSFAMHEITFLGHQLTREGIRPCQDKIKAVQRIEIPRTLKQIRSFLGLASYYRKFIENFARIAEPITQLLSKDVPYQWTEERNNAFEQLKTALTTAPVLSTIDYGSKRGQFKIRTDGSKTGLGGALYQQQADEQKDQKVWKVIAFYSKTLSKTEQNYSITEIECLAVIRTIQRFSHLLRGEHFLIETDHSALTWLKTCKDPPGRLLRWTLLLAEYDYEVKHRSGDSMKEVDALSRLYALREYELPRMENDHFRKLQRKDKYLSTYIDLLENNHVKKGSELKEGVWLKIKNQPRINSVIRRMRLSDGILLYKTKKKRLVRVIPDVMKATLLFMHHDLSSAAHLGVNRTLEGMKLYWWWYDMNHDVALYVSTCHKCQLAKQPTKHQGPLQLLTKVYPPFYKVAIDYHGPFPRSRGYNYLLVVTCMSTKYLILIPMKQSSNSQDKIDSKATAQALLNKVIYTFGIPAVILSDQGSNFVSAMMRELYSNLGIAKQQTTPYHPQTNGQVERHNKTIDNMLKTLISKNQLDWHDYIKDIEFAYNTSVHSATGYSPFYLIFGRHPLLPAPLCYGDLPNLFMEQSVLDRVQALKEARKTIEKRYTKDKSKLMNRANAGKAWRDIEFEIGQPVILYTKKVRSKGTKEKLTPLWSGPYAIEERTGRSTYKLRSQDGKMIGPVNITRLRAYHDRALAQSNEIKTKPKLFSFDKFGMKTEDEATKRAEWKSLLNQPKVNDDWELHPAIFEELQKISGKVNVDLFASERSAKTAKYFTREQDAFKHDWKNLGRLYINPPFRVIHEAIVKCAEESSTALVVMPLEKLVGYEEYFVQPMIELPSLNYNIFKLTYHKQPMDNRSKMTAIAGIIDKRSKRSERDTEKRVIARTKKWNYNDDIAEIYGVEFVKFPHDGNMFVWPHSDQA